MMKPIKICCYCGREILINRENKNLCLKCHLSLNKYCRFCGTYNNVSFSEYCQTLICEECKEEIFGYKQSKNLLNDILKRVEYG